jgi:hypothetical protein
LKAEALFTGYFNVIPKPFACHFVLNKTYSEKPPGPEQMSAKYNTSFVSVIFFWKRMNKEKEQGTG